MKLVSKYNDLKNLAKTHINELPVDIRQKIRDRAISNVEKNMKETKTAYAYHYQIVNEGIDADTPEYYDELNRRIFRAYPELYVIKLSK